VLADQPHPVQLNVALPPTEDRSIADVWTALGGELKPSIDLVAIVPFVIDRHQEAGPPVLETPRLTLAARRGAPERAPRAGRAQGGTAPDKAARAGSADGAGDAETGWAEETVSGGSEEQPGRIVRVRSVRRP
jgi:hypothetical protein